MKGDPEERAAAVGRYIVQSGAGGGSRVRREQIHDLEGPAPPAPPESQPLGRGTGCCAEKQGRASSARRRGHTAQIFAYSILRGARRHSIIE